MRVAGSRSRLPALAFLALSVAHLGAAVAEDVPKRIVAKDLDPDEDWFDDDSLLWIRADRLSHEIPSFFDEHYAMFVAAEEAGGQLPDEVLDSFWPDSDEEELLQEQFFWLWISRAMNQEKYGSAKALGLEDGQLLVDNEVCDPPAPLDPVGRRLSPRLFEQPSSFEWQVEEARAALIGRVSKIAPGFDGSPALLLVIEVEESLVPSAFSYQPFVLLPIGSFVVEDTVYCSEPRAFGGYFPQVGDWIAVLPTTGPWDADRSVIALISHHELFVIDAPDEDGEQSLWAAKAAADGSTPTTLQEFREAVWRIHADKTMEAAYAADNEEAGDEDTRDGEDEQDEDEQPAKQPVSVDERPEPPR